MVQVRHGREEGLRTALTVANNQTLFTAAFNLVHLNDRPCTLQNQADHMLIDVQGVFRSFG